ncbi:hypothetical protein SAMN06265371_10550 [Lutibacter agarilyticus]|uniref:Sporulation related domain-containing protein n=1 Tax=Lutibacter agarilyticus TaxID=1109740 RepID=A0A238X6W8_9FLAO|nr:hypothetical protein [Lutibacter agarilyticus]SNR54805.1 hypothetical protein SAMN06265371_10550 [Lutibacter agarilyticus]
MTKSTKSTFLSLFIILFIGIANARSQSENEKINNLIDQKISYNKKNKNSTVFKIQLYNGNETEAYKIKEDFNTSFPDYHAEVVYDKPEWKTQVNKFKTRLDADRVAIIIKEEFTAAIVLEDKI